MLRAITEGKYSFTSPEWDDISTQAKDLVSCTYSIVYLRISVSVRNESRYLFVCLSISNADIVCGAISDHQVARGGSQAAPNSIRGPRPSVLPAR